MFKTAVMTLVVLILAGAGTAFGKGDRWYKFAADSSVVYYIDQNTIQKTPESTYLFWLKIIPHKKEQLEKEYQLPELAYIIYNYEIDCNRALYKGRATIYFNGKDKQLAKEVPTYLDMSDAEPIAPETVMEKAKTLICDDDADE